MIDLALAADVSADVAEFRDKYMKSACQRKGVQRNELQIDADHENLLNVLSLSFN
jgi:hypothetical protein